MYTLLCYGHFVDATAIMFDNVSRRTLSRDILNRHFLAL